ncbi:MAG: hypothetical protein N2Z57_09375, partial [Oscillospiraceae bacterium]|nr:hypothetical protein [Oscillospiraceae bacterium]
TIMAISLKKPLPGGIALILSGAAYIFFFKLYEHATAFFIIATPLIASGMLYIVSHAASKR